MGEKIDKCQLCLDILESTEKDNTVLCDVVKSYITEYYTDLNGVKDLLNNRLSEDLPIYEYFDYIFDKLTKTYNTLNSEKSCNVRKHLARFFKRTEMLYSIIKYLSIK